VSWLYGTSVADGSVGSVPLHALLSWCREQVKATSSAPGVYPARLGKRAAVPLTGLLYPFFKDELIRETTINCAERGLLLLRVRDELQMTIATYQTLYESSVAFGMRKALQDEQGKSDMEKRVSRAVNPVTWFSTRDTAEGYYT